MTSFENETIQRKGEVYIILTDRQTLNFITWLRIFAVICILLCHYAQESNNVYVKMTAQFFNIGVSIFFIISGFCFGIQGALVDWKKWYKKRAKRIFIPYELFRKRPIVSA